MANPEPQLTKLPDGRMFAPKRGKPPTNVPEGFMRCANEFMFAPVIAPCEHRDEHHKHGCMECGKDIIVTYCTDKDKRVFPGDCFVCQGGEYA